MRGEFDELVIVAPPDVLIAIRERLDRATEARIVGTLKKDLVKTPDDELWPHIAKWVRPGSGMRCKTAWRPECNCPLTCINATEQPAQHGPCASSNSKGEPAEEIQSWRRHLFR
jgi:hypothetical protein